MNSNACFVLLVVCYEVCVEKCVSGVQTSMRMESRGGETVRAAGFVCTDPAIW